ncbi:hypothetical protein HaLaN_03351 [Haematococcus lacustris]|uniref:Uncharacterized protein n=1 Tax=Haematococcus lacustris TaxID=44745 RepID=A0A699YKC3_HAELA|nr:hypothetical protein HaLaN_03351 [Haematococcus lacustris]
MERAAADQCASSGKRRVDSSVSGHAGTSDRGHTSAAHLRLFWWACPLIRKDVLAVIEHMLRLPASEVLPFFT